MGPGGLWWSSVLNSALPPQTLRPDTRTGHQDSVSTRLAVRSRLCASLPPSPRLLGLQQSCCPPPPPLKSHMAPGWRAQGEGACRGMDLGAKPCVAGSGETWVAMPLDLALCFSKYNLNSLISPPAQPPCDGYWQAARVCAGWTGRAPPERPLAPPLSFFFFFFFLFGRPTLHAGSYFPTQGSTPCPLQWKCGVLITGPLGKSQCLSLHLLKLLIHIY